MGLVWFRDGYDVPCNVGEEKEAIGMTLLLDKIRKGLVALIIAFS